MEIRQYIVNNIVHCIDAALQNDNNSGAKSEPEIEHESGNRKAEAKAKVKFETRNKQINFEYFEIKKSK